jgi:kynureninase
LTEEKLRAAVWPRFSRVRARREIYLANHSLGRPPDRMAEDVARALECWYRDLGEAWDAWLAAREKFRTLTATLVGAPGADSIVPKTSAGQGLRAVLNTYDAPIRVVTTDAEFDSIDFILRVYRDRGRLQLAVVPPRVEALVAALAPRCDLVVVSTVLFRTGEILPDLAKLIRRAHAAGVRVLLDVYHHAGVLPLDLASLNADFAIGGSYKYLRGGPGACWLYVHPRHHKLVTLDTGWFAKEDVFKYRRPDPPRFAPGGDAWLESTPPVLAAVQALAGLEFTLETGVERLRHYHLAQKKRFAEILREQGILAEGAGPNFGAFLSLRHLEAERLAAELGRREVAVDARGDRLRLCADLLNSDEELATAASRLRVLLR